MQDIQKKNAKIFIDFFSKELGENYEIGCDWGFPTMHLSISSKIGEVKSTWIFSVNVVEEKYSLASKAYKVVEEKEVPEFTSVDNSILTFVIGHIFRVTREIFGEEVLEEKESESETK